MTNEVVIRSQWHHWSRFIFSYSLKDSCLGLCNTWSNSQTQFSWKPRLKLPDTQPSVSSVQSSESCSAPWACSCREFFWFWSSLSWCLLTLPRPLSFPRRTSLHLALSLSPSGSTIIVLASLSSSKSDLICFSIPCYNVSLILAVLAATVPQVFVR